MRESSQRSAKPASVPLLIHSHHFLAVDEFKRKVYQDQSQVVHDLTDITLLPQYTKAYQRLVLVAHITTAEAAQKLVQTLRGLAVHTPIRNLQIVLIAGRHIWAALRETLGVFEGIEVVPSDIQAHHLYRIVRGKLRALKPLATTNQLSTGNRPPSGRTGSIINVSSPKSNATTTSTPNVILVRGENPLTANPGAPKAKAAPSTRQAIQNAEPSLESKSTQTPAESQEKVTVTFNPVPDSQEIASLVVECISTSTSVVVSSEHHLTQISLRPESYDTSTRLLRGRVAAGRLSDLRNPQSRSVGPLIVNFSLKRCRVFFRAESFDFEDQQASILVPKVIYDVQRRAHLRLKIDPPNKILARIRDNRGPNQGTTFRIHDISAGGICLLASGEQAKLWTSGQAKVESMRLTLAGRDIEVRHLRLTHSKPLPSDKNTFMVGFEFKTIANRDRCFINMFVYRESMEYLDRILGETA